MSRNTPSRDVGSVHPHNSGRAGEYPGEAGPESIGVVVGQDGTARKQLEALLTAARDLRPRLRAEQAETEERGVYSPEMHQAFVEAGFFRVLLPKKLGGFELGIEAFY